MSRRRLVVALLFAVVGITPVAALGVAWGEPSGWRTAATATANGRAAATFPITATTATAPELVQAPARAGVDAEPATSAVKPTVTPTATAPGAPAGTTKPTGRPTRSPKPTATTGTTPPPAPGPTGTPSVQPQTTG